MAERPRSFAQQEILAPLGLTKGELIYVAKKISSGVVHEVPADLKKALTSDPQALAAWRILHRSHATSGYVGLSQLKKQKLEAAGSSGAVQALRMENDAPVVGPDAPTANSKMVKLGLRPWTGVGQLPVCAYPGRTRTCRRVTSASPRCHDGGDVDLLHRHHRLEGTLCLTATGRKRIG